MIKPPKTRYLLASPWLKYFWFSSWILLVVLTTLKGSRELLQMPLEWGSLLWIIGMVVVSSSLGFFMALIFGWFVFGPLYHGLGLKNGAPFHKGDQVRILIGPHRNRIVSIYKVWDERSEVLVELGEKEQKEVTDNYGYHEIWREREESNMRHVPL